MTHNTDKEDNVSVAGQIRKDRERLARRAVSSEQNEAVRLAATACDLVPHPKLKGWSWHPGKPSTGKGQAWRPGRPPVYLHEATGRWVVKTWPSVYGVQHAYYAIGVRMELLGACGLLRDAVKLVSGRRA